MNRGLAITSLAALLAAACSNSAPTPTTSGGPTTSGIIAGPTSVTGTTGSTTSLTGTTGGSTSGGSGTSSSGTGGGTTTDSAGTTGGGTGTSSTSTGGTTGGGRLVIGDGGLIATGQLYPTSITLVPGATGERVFWVNQGTSSEQGAVVQLLSDGGTADFSAWEPDFLTFGNGTLYWSEDVPLDAGGSLALVLAASVDDPGHPILLIDGGSPYGIAVDSNSLYWEDLNLTGANEYIRAFNLDAGTVTNIHQEMIAALQLADIAVDSENVYWVDVPHAMPARVLSTPKNGSGSATILADNQQYISAIAVESSFVYWFAKSMQPDGGLWRASVDGGTAENLYWAEADPFTAVMAVDSTNVYFGPSSSMLSIPLAGGSVTVLESYPSASVITSIAVDSDYVCWTVLRQIGPLVGDVYCLPK